MTRKILVEFQIPTSACSVILNDPVTYRTASQNILPVGIWNFHRVVSGTKILTTYYLLNCEDWCSISKCNKTQVGKLIPSFSLSLGVGGGMNYSKYFRFPSFDCTFERIWIANRGWNSSSRNWRYRRYFSPPNGNNFSQKGVRHSMMALNLRRVFFLSKIQNDKKLR